MCCSLMGSFIRETRSSSTRAPPYLSRPRPFPAFTSATSLSKRVPRTMNQTLLINNRYDKARCVHTVHTQAICRMRKKFLSFVYVITQEKYGVGLLRHDSKIFPFPPQYEGQAASIVMLEKEICFYYAHRNCYPLQNILRSLFSFWAILHSNDKKIPCIYKREFYPLCLDTSKLGRV